MIIQAFLPSIKNSDSVSFLMSDSWTRNTYDKGRTYNLDARFLMPDARNGDNIKSTPFAPGSSISNHNFRRRFMKRFLMLLAVLVFCAAAEAQPVQAQKSTFIAKEASTFHANQIVATNTRTGVSLVVWERVANSGRLIMGRLINAKGIPASPRFTIVDVTAGSHPTVVYNPTRNEFLLAFDDNPNLQLSRSDIYVIRLSAQGRPISGTTTKVSTDTISSTMSNFSAKLVFNPQTSSYVLLWLREIVNSDQADDGNNGLVGVQLTGGGALNGSAVLLQNTVIEDNRLLGPIAQDTTFHPGNNKLLISTVQIKTGTSGRNANYFLGTLNADLSGVSTSSFAQVNSAAVDLSGGFAWGSRIAFPTNTSGLLFFVDTSNIRKRKIDAAGKLTGAVITALKPPKNNTRLFYPSVAFNTVNSVRRGILLAVEGPFNESGAATLWAQTLDGNGAAIGAPVKVDTTGTADTAITSALVGLPAVPNMTGFRFSGFYTLAEFTTPGQSFTNSGLVKLNLTIPAQK
jgi:hypothetical protein